jgi:hypothetical protein
VLVVVDEASAGLLKTTGAFDIVAELVELSPRRFAYNPDIPPPGRTGGADIVGGSCLSRS